MVSKLLSETSITLRELAREAGVNSSTTWRWATHGIKGVVLESVLIGGRRRTSRDAYQRFLSQLNGEPVSTSRRQRQILEADELARQLGA